MDLSAPTTIRSSVAILWPTLHVLGQPALEETRIFLASLRHYEEESFSPARLKDARSVEVVVREIHQLWRELSRLAPPELQKRRQVLAHTIATSALSDAEQSRMMTALDYLCRLSMVRRVSARAWGYPTAEIPTTRNEKMQFAYQRLAELSSADLPMWLSGETGTELDFLARLGHRLRGLEGSRFAKWQPECRLDAPNARAVDDLETAAAQCAPGTLMISDLEQAAPPVHRWVYDRLLKDMGGDPTVRIVVTSQPRDSSEGGVYAELIAYLGPFRVDIPPLRMRTEDLVALFDFLAVSRGANSPAGRLHPEALELLLQYHWPGNVAELDRTLVYLLKKRPAGTIRPDDLKGLLPVRATLPDGLMEVLADTGKIKGFRLLKTGEGCRKVALFLIRYEGSSFDLAQFGRTFSLADSTSRRLLEQLSLAGLVTGIKGAQEKRITRYCPTTRATPGDTSPTADPAQK
ncbi:MAG: hypothetical protein AB1646_23240 [Thermodesulfobacteriota bacterium]